MPKSHSAPAPSLFFVLICLAVMLVTAVQIWHQSAQRSPAVSLASNQVSNDVVSVTPMPTATPVIKMARAPKFGAEIRAEVVLAPPAPAVQQAALDLDPFQVAVASPGSAPKFKLAASPPELPLLTGPESIKVALDRPTKFVKAEATVGLDDAPAMVLPPLSPMASFAADTAAPQLDRNVIDTHGARPAALGITPPTAVVAPRAPTVIAANPVKAPAPSETPAAPENPSASPPANEAQRVWPLQGDKLAGEDLSDHLPLPMPPVVSQTSADPAIPPAQSNAPIAPELPALEAFAAITETPVATTNAIPEQVASDTKQVKQTEEVTETAAKRPAPQPPQDTIQSARIAARNKRQQTDRPTSQSNQTDTAWPVPHSLRMELQQLQGYQAQAGTEEIVAWASQIDAALSALNRASGLNTVDAMPPLRKLRHLIESTPQVKRSGIQSQIMVTRYAVQRRLAVWNRVQAALHPNVLEQVAATQLATNDDTVVQLTRTIRTAFGGGQQAREWTRFLMLDDVEGLAISTDSRGSSERATLASQLLERMNREQLAPAQRAVVQSPVAKQLQTQLRNWSTTEMDYSQLLTAVERMESNPSFAESNRLSELAAQLKWSYSQSQNELASTFYSHYRNANARLAVTELLLNRMLPIVRDSNMPIREQILGARVFGNSASWTQIRLDLVPDNQRLRTNLIANGKINTQTWSYKGPAAVLNRNHSQFRLQKMITCDQQGVHIGKSTTTASTKLNVLGLRTDYDGVPLFGSIARRKVKEQINQQSGLAKRIITNRVAKQAETTVDAQLTQQMIQAEERLEEKLIQPLRKLQLDPTTVSLQTTEERIVYRGRLAAEHHLAAFTPRPNALANSVISLQLHESSINNAIERMRVDGKRGDLREMLVQAANSRPSIKFEIPDDVPEGVTLELANEDAIRMRWHDGNMRISIRVAELAFKRRSWKNFTVSANYRPQVKGLDAELYRDGVVELKGRKRMSMRDQVALRGVFGKVFSKNRNIPLIPDSLAKDRRLADLHVTQFMIRDGWVGVSVGRNAQSVARQRGRNNYRR